MAAIESIAGFPVNLVKVPCGAFDIDLFVVSRLQDYVDTQALLTDADAAEPPYWAHLWTGARALARLIACDIDCRGKRIVDIGCGLGLTSIVAAKRGGAVVAFDLDPHAVEISRANATLNGCRIDVIQADLRTLTLPNQVDYAFAADVTYDPALQIAVADFLHRHLVPGGQGWCAESVRTLDTGMQKACATRGLPVSEHEVRERDEGRDVPVRMICVGTPPSKQ